MQDARILMEVGKRYVVIRASDDRTFKADDHSRSMLTAALVAGRR